MEVKCPKCRFRYDTPVSSGVNEVACVCPRCGTPFTFSVTEGDERPVQRLENGEIQPETQENERAKVPPIPQNSDPRQESQTSSNGKTSSQTPPPFVTPDSYKRNPYSPDYKRKNNGCLRNCLLVFIVSFVVLVFFVRNCYEDHSYGSDVIDKNEFYDDSTDNKLAERGNQIREVLPDGEINRGTFFYKNSNLYCDFGEEKLVLLKLNLKKKIIIYGKLPMVKQN